jgi:hypothetical protein
MQKKKGQDSQIHCGSTYNSWSDKNGEKTAHSAANDQESMLQIVDEEKETTDTGTFTWSPC